MRSIDQATFDKLVEHQKSGAPAEASEIAHFDLSRLYFNEKELDGIAIAMSALPPTRFDSSYSLFGITWIGNVVANSHFVDVSLNKAELLDCRFENCTFERVSLFRADLTGTIFSGCAFHDVDFTQRTTLLRSVFENCRFSRVGLHGGRLVSGSGTISFDQSGTLTEDLGQ